MLQKFVEDGEILEEVTNYAATPKISAMNLIRSLTAPFLTHCLQQTELALAQVGTIRTRLLKLGAQIRLSVRRVHIAICSASPV